MSGSASPTETSSEPARRRQRAEPKSRRSGRASAFRFAQFELQPDRRLLTNRVDGSRHTLREKSLLALLALLESPGEIVTREHLITRLWPGTRYLDFDNNLNVTIRRVRRLLDDDGRRQHFVETAIGQGYRFVPRVERVVSPGPATDSAQADARALAIDRVENRRLGWAAALLCLTWAFLRLGRCARRRRLARLAARIV